jgi:hypothetical protein
MMNDRKPHTRHETDLAARYNPIGIRAVIAALLQIKGRDALGK